MKANLIMYIQRIDDVLTEIQYNHSVLMWILKEVKMLSDEVYQLMRTFALERKVLTRCQMKIFSDFTKIYVRHFEPISALLQTLHNKIDINSILEELLSENTDYVFVILKFQVIKNALQGMIFEFRKIQSIAVSCRAELRMRDSAFSPGYNFVC